MILRFVLIAAIIYLIVALLQKVVTGIRKAKLLALLEQRFLGQRIIMQDLNAGFWGPKLKKYRQPRGKGALILTEMELWYATALPSRELSVPLNNVSAVYLKRVYFGLRPLLCIEVASRSGKDIIAWSVKNPGQWKTAIEKSARLT